MEQINKKIVLVLALVSASYGMKAECLLGRLINGGAGVVCGTTLLTVGLSIVGVGATVHSVSVAKDASPSPLWGPVILGNYLFGSVLMAAGAKVLVDGLKLFFDVEKKKNTESIVESVIV